MSLGFTRRLIWILTLSFCWGFSAHAEPNGDNQLDPYLFVSDNGVTLFDGETLTRRWHRLNDQQTLAPAVTDDLMLVSASRGLYAIAVKQGDILWHRPDLYLGFPVVTDGATAYLASRDGSLTAIHSQNGDEIWHQSLPGWVYPPALAGELLFTGGSDGTLWAIERTSGRIVWSRPLGQEMVYSPVVLAHGQVVVTTFNREILSFDHAGHLLWRHSYPAILMTPVVSGERLIFSGLDQVLRAVDPDNGSVLWQHPLKEPLAVELESQQGVLLATLESGRILAIESAAGAVQQAYQVPGEPVAGPRMINGEIYALIQAFGGPKAVVATRLKQSVKK